MHRLAESGGRKRVLFETALVVTVHNFGLADHFSWQVACSDFVAGAVNRDSWTCGLFSEIGGAKAFGHLDVVFGNAFAANRMGRAARCES